MSIHESGRKIEVQKHAPDLDRNAIEQEAARMAGRQGVSVDSARDVQDFTITTEPGRTDIGNAWRFVQAYEGRVLYVVKWKRWLHWDGCRWVDDGGVGVQEAGKRFAEKLWREFTEAARTSIDRDELSAIRSFVKRTNQRDKIRDFIALAATDERVACQHENLNRDPYLLNVKNGTVDLRTGELGKHSPHDMITQLAPVEYDAEAECPKWLDALDLIFDGDRGMILYLQQLLGYCLSGLVGQHILPIAYGSGCNGKSTITNVMLGLLGDYGTTANAELLLPARHSGHPTEKAQLYQKRFVAISEPSQGRRLDESKTKELTGGDQVNCRRVQEDFWTFAPTHKFWMSTNHKPRIGGTDEGIWRRVKLIPFTVDLRTKTDPRPGLSDWLIENEGPGILAWAVQGFRDWLELGFSEPATVTEATADYRAAEDELGEWLSEFCIVEAAAVEQAGRLFESYQRAGGKLTKTAFGERMGHQFEKEKPTTGPNRKKVVYHGLRLADGASSE
jgi:P4 family phage/plasmid primase-like protien